MTTVKRPIFFVAEEVNWEKANAWIKQLVIQDLICDLLLVTASKEEATICKKD